MYLKDYYSTLELPPSATQQEIKKAYHRLALQFHPDKNLNNPHTTARFTEIKEAYEVLTNPAKKEYSLQQRWYNQSIGKRKMQSLLTPVAVLKQVLELDKYVSLLDIHRMDKEGLYSYLRAVISDDTITRLNEYDERDINREIIIGLLNSSLLLPAQFAMALLTRLLKIHGDETSTQKINDAMETVQKQQVWEKYQVWIILLIVALVSLLIFFLGK